MPEQTQENAATEQERKDRLGFVYSVIMLLGGVPLVKYLIPGNGGNSWWRLLATALVIQLACVGLGIVLKLVRRIFRNRKEELFSKAFWLDAVEEGFSVWCLLVVLYVFRYLQWLEATGQLNIF